MKRSARHNYRDRRHIGGGVNVMEHAERDPCRAWDSWRDMGGHARRRLARPDPCETAAVLVRAKDAIATARRKKSGTELPACVLGSIILRQVGIAEDDYDSVTTLAARDSTCPVT